MHNYANNAMQFALVCIAVHNVVMVYERYAIESSTCLESPIEYNFKGGWLRVQFTDGTVWTYGPGIDWDTIVDLMMASSPGRFFNAFIRELY